MDILFWNCRGICNPSTRRALKTLISQHKPAIVFLIETKIRENEEFGRLQRTLGFVHAEGFLSVGQSGGLGLFWNEETRVHIRQPSHARFIDAVVDDDNGQIQWRLTCFYDNPSAAERQESWNLIRSLSDDDSLPWVVLGDFNEIVHSSEKLDGRLRPESQMRGFREALSYAELVDLGFHGCPYTWSDSETKVRLDRVMVTAAWLDCFSHSRVIHLPPSKSDHIPILLRVSASPIAVRKRFYRFRFEALWLQYDRCHDLVQEQWHKPVSGQPMFLVAKKIENTSIALDKWQRPFFGDRQKTINAIRGRLEELLGLSSSPDLQAEKNALLERLEALLSEEETSGKTNNRHSE